MLAVFPTISEVAAPLTLGPTQTTAVTIDAQPVPDSVTVGPDGALYVGELGGEPFDVGTSSVYRVVPGHAPQVYASGFTAIGDIAFDHWGRLLVLEIDQAGINDPALASGGLPTPGAIIRVGPQRVSDDGRIHRARVPHGHGGRAGRHRLCLELRGPLGHGWPGRRQW